MKLSKTILPTLLLSFLVFQKANSQCDNSAIEYIAANKVKAAVCTGGDFFWDRSDGKFIVPYVPGQTIETSTFYAAGIWLGGYDSGGNLKTACQVYGNANGIADFWAGPIDDTTMGVLPDGCENFNHVWKTNRGSILQIIKDFEDNGVIDSTVPPSILSWPAKGNPHFETVMGFALPDQELAPFFDRNGNGIYEPINGEYPVIGPDLLSVVPDELTWTVFNDIQNVHLETGGVPLGVEVHFMSYAFNCSDNEVLNHTVFTRHKVFNKSVEGLLNFRMAIGADIDIGCFNDDYFGCDTILNSAYLYNKDNNDTGVFCSSGGIGVNPPIQAITFLNHNMEKLSVHYDLTSLDPPPAWVVRKPTLDFEYYNLLEGKWRDGTPITYGNSGYDTASIEFVNHLFFDNPNDQFGWSQKAVIGLFWEPNIVMSFSAEELPVGSSIVLDAAFSYHRQPDSNFIENVNVALDAIPMIQEFYNNGMITTCSQSVFCDSDCVWPGDGNDDGIAKNDDLLHIGITMGNNANGPIRNPSSIVWSPYYADMWGSLSGAIDQKHQDCNGDGVVNELDWHVLEVNYNKQRPDFIFTETLAPFAEGEIYLDINKVEISTTIANSLQRSIRANILVGTQVSPISELYGIAFTVKYDTSIWEQVPGLAILKLQDNTPLGNLEEVMVIEEVNQEEGRIEITISRKDGLAFSNVYGEIGSIKLGFKEDAPTGNPNGIQNLSFEVYDAIGVDGQDSLFQLGAYSDIVIGKDMIYDSTLIAADKYFIEKMLFSIAPNPSNGTFNLLFEKTKDTSLISLFDFNGKTILSKKIPTDTEQQAIDLNGQLPTGIYFVKWTLEDGRFTTRKVIVK